MSAPFLITGYPRSRTAWLANFLTQGDVFCGHEMLATLKTPEALIAWMRDWRHGRLRGAAETWALSCFGEMTRLCPTLRVVLVEREPDEISKSLSMIGLGDECVDILFSAMQQAKKWPRTLYVRFEELQREDACRAIFSHVAPGRAFDKARWDMLKDFNVQITPERIAEITRLAQENYLK